MINIIYTLSQSIRVYHVHMSITSIEILSSAIYKEENIW